jgi:hypothetical protein
LRRIFRMRYLLFLYLSFFVYLLVSLDVGLQWIL